MNSNNFRQGQNDSAGKVKRLFSSAYEILQIHSNSAVSCQWATSGKTISFNLQTVLSSPHFEALKLLSDVLGS